MSGAGRLVSVVVGVAWTAVGISGKGNGCVEVATSCPPASVMAGAGWQDASRIAAIMAKNINDRRAYRFMRTSRFCMDLRFFDYHCAHPVMERFDYQ
jgi:hypothetical protein